MRSFAVSTFVMLMVLVPATFTLAETQEEFNLDRNRAPQGNLLDLVFGSPPPMATERGILVLDAFVDANGNGRRDQEEADLVGQVSCAIDGIDYLLPAFIPGLKYEGTYQLTCRGAVINTKSVTPELFIAQRGAIIRIDIPCEPIATESDAPGSQKDPAPSRIN